MHTCARTVTITHTALVLAPIARQRVIRVTGELDIVPYSFVIRTFPSHLLGMAAFWRMIGFSASTAPRDSHSTASVHSSPASACSEPGVLSRSKLTLAASPVSADVDDFVCVRKEVSYAQVLWE